MSSLSLASKIAIGLVSGVATVGGLAGTAYGLGIGPFSSGLVDVIVESTTVTGESTGSLKTGDKQNYYCQAGTDATKTDKSCSMKELDLSSFSTNKVIKSSFNLSVKDAEINHSDIKTASKYYKVTVSSSFYDSLTKGNANSNIAIHKIDGDTKLSELKILFAVKDKKFLGKVNSFAGKVNELSSSLTVASTTFKCSNDLPCDVYGVNGANGAAGSIDVETFSHTTGTKATTVENNKTYIFKYSGSPAAQDINSLKSPVVSSVTSTPSTTTNINLKDIVPVVITSESSGPYLFLLK